MSLFNRKPASEGIELRPLAGPSSAPGKATPHIIAQPPDESSVTWAWATAAWFIILALPLLVFPRFILFLSMPGNVSTNELRETLTPLEQYICTHVSIGLIALAITLIVTIPTPPPVTQEGVAPPAPTHPLVIPLSLALSTTSFISYNTRSVGALATIMTLGCGLTGLWGIWVIMFQGPLVISHKTGADKHTSAFLFGNKASASEQKKLWKKEKEREQAEQYELKKL